MAVLQNNQYHSAIWGAHHKFITGLDPLGLQNTSEALYTRLLPGITNLTNRIRYYGFYCWLLDQYAHQERDTNPKSQYRYIRRAEFTLALLMQHENEGYTQVTGSRSAYQFIQSSDSGTYDFSQKTDDHKASGTYWKFPSGAFGQYYLGAMRNMGLVTRNKHDNFIATQAEEGREISGVQMAEAFALSISDDASRLFIQTIKKGQLREQDVKVLYQAFGLDHIPPVSEEAQLYEQLLLQPDQLRWATDLQAEQQTYFRRNTIQSILQIRATEGPTEQNPLPNLQQHAYRSKESEEAPHQQLWYFYELNELWQYAMGTIFWFLLCRLEQEVYPVPCNAWLALQVREMISTGEAGVEEQLGALVQRQHQDEYTCLATIVTAVNGRQPLSAAWSAFELLLVLYRENQGHLPTLRKLGQQYQVFRSRRTSVVDFITRLENSQDQEVSDFLKDLLRQHLIHRHLFVAYRKAGNGSQSTQKLILEENHLRHVQTFPPRFTSPRLGVLHRIMQDLGWIDEHYGITPQGQALLNKKELWN